VPKRMSGRKRTQYRIESVGGGGAAGFATSRRRFSVERKKEWPREPLLGNQKPIVTGLAEREAATVPGRGRRLDTLDLGGTNQLFASE
jgi:hypothetical protein